MKRILLSSLMYLSLLSASGAAFADSMATGSSLQAQLVKGASLMQAGNLDAAETIMQKTYDQATAAGDPQILCQAAFQLGIVKTALHKTADAEKAFDVALKIVRKVMPPNSPMEALAKCLLADLYLTENRPAEAESLYEEGIPYLPTTPPTLAAEKTINMALCYLRDDKLDLAEQAFHRGIAAFTSCTGADSFETAASTANFASFQLDRGNYDMARTLAEQVLRAKGANNTVKATANNVLAHVYDAQGNYGKAMHIAQKSLDEFRNSKSTDAVKEADALMMIGRIYKDGHRYREAETVIDKALASLAKASPDNPDYSDALREKGDLLVWQGQYEQAKPLIEQSKSLRVQFLGAQNSDVAQNLADLGYIYQQENDYAKAEENYKGALAIYLKTRGDKNHYYLETLQKLGDLYKLSNRKAEAEQALNTVLATRKATLPKDSPDISNTMVSLASLYQGGGQDAAKAESMFADLIERDNAFGAPPGQKASDLQDLASAQKSLGKTSQAAENARKAEAIMTSLPGAEAVVNVIKAPFDDSPVSSGDEKKVGGDKWCLCVGISNFKDTSINLKYSAKDATDFKNFLIDKAQFKPDHVKLLVDESATRQNLIDQLGDSWLASNVKPNDLVVVYISSHGSQAIEEAHGVNFLVTYDTNKNSLLATGIPMQWLSKIISEQVKCRRTVILLDVCHSGSIADWSDEQSSEGVIASGDAGSGNKGLKRVFTSDPQSIVPTSGQVILCSSGKAQTSWESKRYANSVFTKQLMDAMSMHGPATTFTEAYAPLKSKVENEVLRDRGEVQTPQINDKGAALSPLAK